MPRTLAVALFVVSLLVPAQAVFAENGIAESLGEARTHYIWRYDVFERHSYIDPAPTYQYDAANQGMLTHLEIALTGRIRCQPDTETKPLGCVTTLLDFPSVDATGKVVARYENVCSRTVQAYVTHTVEPICRPHGQFGSGGVWGTYYSLGDGKCPVDDMLPHPTDACSISLENSGGLRPALPPTCPADQTKSDPDGESCFKEKMALLGIPYNGPTGTVRTLGYQKHLYDLWSKDRQHKAIIKEGDPAEIAACAERKKIIDNEINNIHGGITTPTKGNGPDTHSTGKGFDVSQNTVDALVSRMQQDANNVFAWLLAPPPRSCNLKWGGDFQRSEKDPVHFQILK